MDRKLLSKQLNIKKLNQFKDKNYGKPGTQKRDMLDTGYDNFKINALIHDARIERYNKLSNLL